MEPYFLLNVSGEIKIPYKMWTFTPYIRVDNLTNTQYESVTDYPMPGINGTLGVKINL